MALCEEEAVELLESPGDRVPVFVKAMLRVIHGEREEDEEADDVLDDLIVRVPVEEDVGVLDVLAEPEDVGLPVEVLERPGDPVVVLEPVILRVEVELPVVVVVDLPERESRGLEVVVFDWPLERVEVLVEVRVFVEAAVIVVFNEGTALRLCAEVRVDVLVDTEESVLRTLPAISCLLRPCRCKASAPSSVRLVQGLLILPITDASSNQRIIYRGL